MYLRQEATRDGLEPVANIIWHALTDVEAWLETGDAPVSSRDIIDGPLCQSLDFLFTWLSLQPERQQEIAREIAKYETPGIGKVAVPRLNRKLSKKKAN